MFLLKGGVLALDKLLTKEFWIATGIRCLRTFLTTILGVWTAGTMITEIDWYTTFVSAISATIYILLLCIVAGIPEVKEVKVKEE